MTRQPFKLLVSSLALTAVLISPAATAWVAVSLPGNAMTMSGVRHAEPTPAQAQSTSLPASPELRKAQRGRAPVLRPQAARAGGFGLRLPTR